MNDRRSVTSQRPGTISFTPSASDIYASNTHSARQPAVPNRVATPPKNVTELLERISGGRESIVERVSGSSADRGVGPLPQEAWPKLVLPPIERQGNEPGYIRGRLVEAGQMDTSQLNDLNERIRAVATKLRLVEAENDVRLAVDGDNTIHGNLVTGKADAPRIFDSIFLTEVPQSETPPEKDKMQYIPAPPPEPKTVESLPIPPLTADPNPLPHQASPRKMLTTALRTTKTRTHHRVRQILLSPESEDILKDCFWYIVFSRFRDKEAGDAETKKIFGRIASSYVRILIKMGGRDKDDFSLLFPNMMSHALYTTFTTCFPDSSQHFTEEFQTYLCDLLSEWMNGIKPSFPYCVLWRLVQERPGTLKRKDEKREPVEQDISLLELMGGNDDLGDAGRMGQDTTPSARPNTLPQTRRILFDSNSNSIMIRQFIGARERRTVNIRRTELIRSPQSPHTSPNDNTQSTDALTDDPEAKPTYRQIILESLKRSRNLQKAYKTSQEEAQREKNRILQALSEEIKSERRRIARILARPEQVKDTADQIVADIMKYKEGNNELKVM